MRRISISTAAIVICAAMARPLPADQPAPARLADAALAADATNLIAEFEITRKCDLLIIPITIDGHEYPFILDTGSSCCVIDTSLQPLVSKTKLTAKFNGKKGFEIYRLPEFHMGKVGVPAGAEAISCDLIWWRVVLGHDIRGFLGMNVLKSHVVRIDFDAGKVQFLRDAPKSADADFALSYSSTRIPLVETAFLTGKSCKFRLDSGLASAGEVNAETFKMLHKQGSLAEARPSLSLKFDGFRLARWASMKVPRPAQFDPWQLQFSPGKFNVLGLGFLSVYDVTLDFPNDCLYLQRGKHLADSFLESKSALPSEYEKIISDYDESIRLDPNVADGYIARSREWIDKRQFRKAIADCNRAIRLDPSCSIAYLIRSSARLGLDELDKASADFEEAARLMQAYDDFCEALLLVR